MCRKDFYIQAIYFLNAQNSKMLSNKNYTLKRALTVQKSCAVTKIFLKGVVVLLKLHTLMDTEFRDAFEEETSNALNHFCQLDIYSEINKCCGNKSPKKIKSGS